MSTSTPSLVKAVHTMLGHYLGKYQKVVAKLPTSVYNTLLEATDAYLQLDSFMSQMHYLIKVYIEFIDEDLEAISNLKAPPTPATTDQEPVIENPSNSNAVQHSSISDRAPVTQSDLIDVKEIGETGLADKWGTSAFQWLHAVVGQIHAAKWLWTNRKNIRRDALLHQLLERLCGQEGIATMSHVAEGV